MVQIPNFFSYNVLGNTIQNYIISAAIFIVVFTILYIFKVVVLSRVKKFAKKTKNKYDDVIVEAVDTISIPMYIYVSLFISLQYLSLPELADKIILGIFLAAVTYYITKGIFVLMDLAAKTYVLKTKDADEQYIGLLTRIAKFALWIIAFLLIVSNLGYDITTLIAGLGIGGLAIAFALQNVLGDIFASVSLHLDKPFKVGHFIIVGADMGVVKNIGIKSTRIQALQGQEIVISNKELTETRVHNYKRMKKRRVVFTIGVTYNTPKTKLEKIPKIIKKIIDKQEKADIDRSHFKEFGASSLNYETVYYIDTNDYNVYMDIQQAINLEIVNAFQKEKIEFAFPTQTIYLEK